MDSIVVPIYKGRIVKLARGVVVQGTKGKTGKIIRLTSQKACVHWDEPNRDGESLAYLFYSGIQCSLPTVVPPNGKDTGKDQAMEFPYYYAWNRMDRKGQFCRVICRGKMNSCLLEFEDGFRAVTSRNAIHKRQRDQQE